MKALFYSPGSTAVSRVVDVARVDWDEVTKEIYLILDTDGGRYFMDEGMTVKLVEDWAGVPGDPLPAVTIDTPATELAMPRSSLERKLRNLIARVRTDISQLQADRDTAQQAIVALRARVKALEDAR
jgi:hypothetical protein